MIKEKATEINSSNKMRLSVGKWLLIIGVSLMFTVSASAQTSTDPDNDQVPFDGGVSLLVAAGVAYGTKQWHNARKNNKEQNEKTNA